MRVSDADILIVPGAGDTAADHWQSRWLAKLSTARSVAPDWSDLSGEAWVGRIVEAVRATERPCILVPHGLAVIAAAHAAPALGPRVKGAFLVAPSATLETPAARDLAPAPLAPLTFPSVLVASRNDPFCPAQRAADLAEAWGSEFVDAGDAGHIDVASGHGPWPEGLMRFAGFLSKLA